MFENERIGKVDTSREQEFLRRYGLIGEPEQATVHGEEAGRRTERNVLERIQWQQIRTYC